MQTVPASWPEAREDCGVPGRHPALAARSAVQCRQLCDLPDTPSLLAAALGRAGSAGGEERRRGFESRHLPEGALRSLRAGSFRGEGLPEGARGRGPAAGEGGAGGPSRGICQIPLPPVPRTAGPSQSHTHKWGRGTIRTSKRVSKALWITTHFDFPLWNAGEVWLEDSVTS